MLAWRCETVKEHEESDVRGRGETRDEYWTQGNRKDETESPRY